MKNSKKKQNENDLIEEESSKKSLTNSITQRSTSATNGNRSTNVETTSTKKSKTMKTINSSALDDLEESSSTSDVDDDNERDDNNVNCTIPIRVTSGRDSNELIELNVCRVCFLGLHRICCTNAVESIDVNDIIKQIYLINSADRKKFGESLIAKQVMNIVDDTVDLSSKKSKKELFNKIKKVDKSREQMNKVNKSFSKSRTKTKITKKDFKTNDNEERSESKWNDNGQMFTFGQMSKWTNEPSGKVTESVNSSINTTDNEWRLESVTKQNKSIDETSERPNWRDWQVNDFVKLLEQRQNHRLSQKKSSKHQVAQIKRKDKMEQTNVSNQTLPKTAKKIAEKKIEKKRLTPKIAF